MSSIAGNYPNWGLESEYQTLVEDNLTSEFGSGTYQFLPVLAQNWTVSANGTLYTFNLRQNVTFSNGDPFNAYQVWADEYGYYYTSDNATGWLVGYTLMNMTNVDFGPATLALLNESGLINPSQSLLAIMQNRSLANVCDQPIPN